MDACLTVGNYPSDGAGSTFEQPCKETGESGQTTVSQNIPDSENVQAADTESSGQETQNLLTIKL